ncbi:LCP family protein [Radiobacillus deserti]|uniref:LytR family transcriptional regulator n=1 Tax=Radiobacillus deserti TaxID=2594883 RepID=A0A516KI78_9BACI|nr:LCP family protein [Radiobacillus deserti]QDP41092.1 LytR family transcriptional regulator [Radiobacillus deserti]
MPELRTERKKEKKRKRKKWLYLISIPFLLIIGFGLYLFYETYSAAKESYVSLDREDDKSELREKKVTIGDDPMSILLIGVEDYSTDGENGRADTQIVVTLNPKQKQMTMTTIPRDTKVELTSPKVPEQFAGIHRITDAHSLGSMSGYGGDKLVIETVENLLDIPIDEFVTVNFEGFRDIVNTLGGVTIDIKKGFWEKNIYDNNNRIEFSPGVTKLNGEEALAFVRMRKREVAATYTRDERQRQFIKAAIDEVISAGTIFNIGEISDILGKNINTSLKPNEIFALQKMYASMDVSSIQSYELKGVNDRLNGGLYYFFPDETGLAQTTQRLKEELNLTKSQHTNEESTNPNASS